MNVANIPDHFLARTGAINEALPNENLLSIFSYLDYPDQSRCLLVCRFWKVLICGSSLEIRKIHNQLRFVLLGKHTHSQCFPEQVNSMGGHCIRLQYLGHGQFYVMKGGNDYLITLKENPTDVSETHILGTGNWKEYREVHSLDAKTICLKECSSGRFLSVVDRATLNVSSLPIKELICVPLPEHQVAVLTETGNLSIFAKMKTIYRQVFSCSIEKSQHLIPLSVDNQRYVVRLRVAPNNQLFFIFKDKTGLFSLHDQQFVPMSLNGYESFFTDDKCKFISESNRLIAVSADSIIELVHDGNWTKLSDLKEAESGVVDRQFVYQFDTYEHKIPKFMVKGKEILGETRDKDQIFYNIIEVKTGNIVYKTEKSKQVLRCINDQGFFAYSGKKSIYVSHIGLNKKIKIPRISSLLLSRIVSWDQNRFIAIYENEGRCFFQPTNIFFQIISI